MRFIRFLTRRPCLLDMAAKASLMRDIGIDMRYCICIVMHKIILYVSIKQRMISSIMQVNPDLVTSLENSGLSFTGKDETGQRMEVL